MEMSYLRRALHTCAQAYLHVRTLIFHRVLGVDAHKSALGVLPVERALRTAQHVYSVHLIVVHIKRALAQQWHSVEIHSHRRIVNARADATYIYCRRETRTVFRHDKRGYKGCQIPHVLNAQGRQFAAGEHRRTHRLASQRITFFRLRNHDNLIKVYHLR